MTTIRRLVCSFVAVLLCCAAFSRGATAQTKYALLVGINNYQPPGSPPPAARSAEPDGPLSGGSAASARSRWDLPVWPKLEGSVNDAAAIRDLLASPKFGFPEKNIHLLTDAEATRQSILTAMQKYLVDQPQRGDVVVFYYAGHGSLRYNSKNGRPDHFDETIVAEDANSRVFDIRNKDIARIFNAAIDKGVLVTAIFDSCHSGGVARGIPVGAPGKTRFLPYDPRDANDPPDRRADGSRVPRPEERPGGAVVLAAAQADQLASEWITDDGTPHGAFTVALMDTLSRLPADASAQQIFARTKVLMQGMGFNAQQPALDAPGDRREASLFGKAQGPGKPVVSAGPEGVRADRTLTLDGGLDLGLSPGCELARVKLNPSDPVVRVRVVSAVLGHSTAKLLAPAVPREVEPGDQFELEKWVAPEFGRLRLWMPPALPAADIARASAEASKLRHSDKIVWVEDPVKLSPTHLVEWNGSTWALRSSTGGQEVLEAELAAAQVLAKLGGGSPKPRLFVYLPPSQELALGLRSQLRDQAKSALELVSKPEIAQYLLAGRATENGLEYSWIQKNITSSPDSAGIGQHTGDDGTLCSSDSPYPPRTNWFAAVPANETAERLADYALRLERVYAWLNLPAPASGAAEAFPYRLALQKLGVEGTEHQGTATLTDTGPVREGESYGLLLKAAETPADDFKPRWVYVLGISCDGGGKLLYPISGQNNHQPKRSSETAPWPKLVDLTGSAESIIIAKPFGVDTYVLLTTSDQISDLGVFNFEAALSRGFGQTPADPLSRLLENSSSGSRGMGVVENVPANWSVRYTHVLSVPKSSP